MSSLSVFIFIVLFNINEIFSSYVDHSQTVALYNVYELNPFGDYYYKYQLSDGQAVDVTGRLKEVDGNQVYVVTGSYTYEAPNGNVYTVNYIADENGYRTVNENVATATSGYSYHTTARTTPPPTVNENVATATSGYSYHTTARTTPPPTPATVRPIKPGQRAEFNPRNKIGIGEQN